LFAPANEFSLGHGVREFRHLNVHWHKKKKG
jgi:hypothetical protein